MADEKIDTGKVVASLSSRYRWTGLWLALSGKERKALFTVSVLTVFILFACIKGLNSDRNNIWNEIRKRHVVAFLDKHDGSDDVLLTDLHLDCEPNASVAIDAKGNWGCWNFGESTFLKMNGFLEVYPMKYGRVNPDFRNLRGVIDKEFEKKVRDNFDVSGTAIKVKGVSLNNAQ